MDLPLIFKIVYDDHTNDPSFQTGDGFSCYVEWGHRKILFDTGRGGSALFSNLEKMGISLEQLTHLVFSHKDSNHTGSFEEVVKRVGPQAILYVPKWFPRLLLKKVPPHLPIRHMELFTRIAPETYSFVARGSWSLFLYEQSLFFETHRGLVVLTACSHPGIFPILKAAKKRLRKPIHLVIGGFHLFRASVDQCLNMARHLQNLDVERVAPCHCTGEVACHLLKEAYHEHYLDIGVGSVIEVE